MNKLFSLFIDLISILPKKSKITITTVVVLSVFSIMSVAATPILMSHITDLINSRKNNSIEIAVLLLGVSYILIISITKVINFLSMYLQSLLRISCIKEVSNLYLRSLYLFPNKKNNTENSGATTQRLHNANNDIYSIISSLAFNVIPPLFQVIFSIVAIFIAGDVIVALCFMAYVFVFVFVSNHLTTKLIDYRKEMMSSGIVAYSLLTDSVKNIHAARACNSYSLFFGRYSDYLDKDITIQNKYWKGNLKLVAVSSAINVVFFGFVFIYSLMRVIHSDITLGHFIMVTSYIFVLSSPLENIGSMFSKMKQSIFSLNLFFESLKQAKLVKIPTPQKKQMLDTPVAITLRNISYYYTDNNLILNNLDFVVSPGSFVSITGKSGSGKSTLAKIIARNLNPTNGVVLFNDIDIKNIPAHEFHSLVYHVTQDDFVFMDTIRFNLKIANPEASDIQLYEAINLSNLSDEFKGMSDDILSLRVGDEGSTLSGGQKQRLSLARLFLREPKIIILDEITSSLDYQNEEGIMKNIRTKFPSSTIISISHRETTLKHSDKIMVLTGGNFET